MLFSIPRQVLSSPSIEGENGGMEGCAGASRGANSDVTRPNDSASSVNEHLLDGSIDLFEEMF